jgi:transcriptional antiterminator NusG
MEKKWYVIHTLSGQEARVKEQLEHKVAVEKLENDFGRILLPTQEILTIKKGKKVTQTKKFFPSYLIAEMDLTRESVHLVMSMPGVTNFVGGRKPQPLTQPEVDRILGKIDPQKRKQDSEGDGKRFWKTHPG